MNRWLSVISSASAPTSRSLIASLNASTTSTGSVTHILRAQLKYRDAGACNARAVVVGSDGRRFVDRTAAVPLRAALDGSDRASVPIWRRGPTSDLGGSRRFAAHWEALSRLARRSCRWTSAAGIEKE